MRKTNDTKVNEVFDKGLENLESIWAMLLEEAKGVHFVVYPDLPNRDKPKTSAKFVTKAQEVEKVCKTCKQPVLHEPPVLWEVWRERRDSAMLKYLFDQLVGKANQKTAEKFDPEIIVQFGDIDSVADAVTTAEEAVEGGSKATDFKGSISNSDEEEEVLGIE